jgi:hypothetical protein
MAVIHQINCATNRKNVGFGAGCPLDWKLIAGAIIWDQPKIFSAPELANLQVILQNLAWSDTAANRCYPIGNFVNPQDNTEKPVIQSFSDGSKAKVRDGTYDWTFQFTIGGFPLLQALQTHNGNGSVYAIFYDKNNNVLGYNNGGNFAAIPLQIFDAEPWMMNTGQATAVYNVHFVFAKQYANDVAEYFNAGFDMSTINGLQDIKPIVNGFNQATGLANITFLTESGGGNLYDVYSADFTTAIFTATNATTGGDISITTITPLVANKSFNVQLNHADPDWPADGNVALAFKAPSALAAAGLVGFAGETVYLETTSS